MKRFDIQKKYGIEELFGSAYTHLGYVDPFKTEAK